MIVAHLVGDYCLQSDWMALEKTKRSGAALAHAATYTLPFMLLLPPAHGGMGLAFIFISHFVIDRWRLARYVCWLKNFLSPPHTYGPTDLFGHRDETKWRHPWSVCSTTGYHKDRPPWLATWLLFIADNTLHLICNGIALSYLRG